MPYIYLILSVFLIASNSILGTFYNKKNVGKNSTAIYNLLLVFGALISWALISLTSFEFHAETLWFSLFFGVSYLLCNLSMILALKNGPVSLTSLFLQLSLIGVTIWGFIFWNEKINLTVIIGLIVAVISITFCLYQKNDSSENKLNAKWLFFACALFLSNGACTVIQKTQIRVYGENYGNMLMLFAMLFACVFCLIHFLLSNKKDAKVIIKRTGYIPLIAGFFNGMLNLFVILMATKLPSSVVYPIISVGGLCISIFASVVIFKEKLEKNQWIGIALGVLAVLFLTI